MNTKKYHQKGNNYRNKANDVIGELKIKGKRLGYSEACAATSKQSDPVPFASIWRELTIWSACSQYS